MADSQDKNRVDLLPPPEQLRVFHIGGYWRGENDIVRQLMLSLKSIGVNVYEYNTDEHREALDCDGLPYNRGTFGPVWLRWELLRPEIEAFEPDLIICNAGGLSFRPEVALKLRKKIGLLGIALSDPDVFTQTTQYIAPTFDLYLTNYAERVPDYLALGANAAVLPYGTNEEFFRPVPPRPEYECDVVVFGRAHDERVEPVRAIAENFNLHLYGEDWEPHGLSSRGTLEGENLLSALKSAKFTLVTNTTLFHTPVVKIVMLDFMAAGALVVTNYFEPTKQYFEYGREIIGFSSVQDLIEKIRYYLDHPEEAGAIRAAGRARVLRDYRWKDVWPGILEQVAAVRGRATTGIRRGQILSSELERPAGQSDLISPLMAEQQQTNADNWPLLEQHRQVIAEQRQVIESLQAQLSNTQVELSKITNSLGWRLLSRYGRIKYRYLLPVYRWLGRLRGQKRKKGRSELSDTVKQADG